MSILLQPNNAPPSSGPREKEGGKQHQKIARNLPTKPSANPISQVCLQSSPPNSGFLPYPFQTRIGAVCPRHEAVTVASVVPTVPRSPMGAVVRYVSVVITPPRCVRHASVTATVESFHCRWESTLLMLRRAFCHRKWRSIHLSRRQLASFARPMFLGMVNYPQKFCVVA